jgi:hypothetical protein
MRRAVRALVFIGAAVALVAVGALLGGAGETWLYVLGLRSGSKVSVVNLSGHVLQNVVVVAGRDRHVISSIGEGTYACVTLHPRGSSPLIVRFTCNGRRRKAYCAQIGDMGEHRTVQVESEGHAVIISFGTANAVAMYKQTEEEPLREAEGVTDKLH